MTKIAALLLAVLFAVPALAQPGPGGGPGPGPVPDPWIVNGATISYNAGGLTIPSTVTGGSQGAGTINANGIYVQGTSISGVLATAPIVASAVVSGARTLSLNIDANFSVVASRLALASGGVAYPSTVSGGAQGAGTINASGLYVNGVAVTGAGITALTGDVVATGPGSVAATIQAGVVTYAKLQSVAASSLVGNPTASLASAQAVALGATFAFSGTTLQTTAHTGDVTSSANSNAMTLVTAQPGAHTWAAAQTFTLAPIFTDQSGTRSALGLGTAALQNTGTSGANVPLLNGANTWGAVQTLPSPALTGTVTGSNTIPLSILQQSAANTMVGNWTGSTANVVANSMPSCPDSGGNHLNYVSGTGVTCGTGIGSGITALTGDVTATGPGSVAATLATVNSNVGTFGSATQSVQITVNGKGLVTAAASVTVTPSVGSVTGLGTGVATALGVNVGTAGALVVNGGALGTPSSGVATNLTGTAAGLTAGTVTTNANLTGDVTSSGNATTIAANAVTNAKAAQMAAYTFKGNVTGSTANATDFTIAGLTNKTVPVGGDLIILADSAASNATKYASLTQALGAVTSGVSSIAGNTGSFTLSGGITNSVNDIRIDLAANLTWSGIQTHNNTTVRLLGSSTGYTAITSANAGASNYVLTLQAASGTAALLDVASQTVSGGAVVSVNPLGTVSSGTTTVNCGIRPIHSLTNGGAFTLAAPANDGSCFIEVTNNGSAGAITFSGFNVGTGYTGGPLTTVNGSRFMIFVARGNGRSVYNVTPQQ